MGHDVELLPGTLDLLILKALSLGPLNGYGVLLRIGQMSGGALQIEQGAFYTAMYPSRVRGCSIRSGPSPTTIGRPSTTG